MRKLFLILSKILGYKVYNRKYPELAPNLINDEKFFLEQATEKKEVLNFIKNLYPIATQNELIRIGSKGDGGYLLPDDLEGIEACFSPGVSCNSAFEKECYSKGMKIFMADASVETVNLDSKVKYDFRKKFIGAFSDKTFMTLNQWVEEADVDKSADLILQMDIEGYEYQTLLNTSESVLNRFRIIVLECHNFHKLFNLEFFGFADVAFKKLLKNHVCVHNHPNNFRSILNIQGVDIPQTTELTFYRKDRVETENLATKFPHPLDEDNSDLNPPISLPKNWYSN